MIAKQNPEVFAECRMSIPPPYPSPQEGIKERNKRRQKMKAAIYARYSSENQSEKSIDDQVRVCKNYCKEHEITVSDEHI
ncbi:MAG: recombinase family protein [Candidatus Omnitrophica bacterium]|nr:recombinase family protein [Candidatus Omnitrophota bacterium]